MANLAQPEVFINYISQRKKIIVTDHNQPTQLLIQTDYYLNDTLYFKVLNVNNQVVQLDSENTTYQLYGTYIDSKKQVHILFYTLGVHPTDNTLSFLVNTYTSEYLAYVKNNRTPIDISIVAKQNVGGSTRSYMVLRDTALANPRGYIEGQAPTDIVYQNVFTTNVPVSGVFGAGSNNLSLAQDLEGQEIYSFAFGDTLSTNNANQFVIGYNNEPDGTKAFIVANSGNIFTVDYDGNVEAGDLNVGAISATSITVSGEDLNQVIDEKVEYLSTSIDDKLSATEDWVSNTFETSANATATYNALEQDISDLSGEVYNTFETKEDATNKFEFLTGQVDGLSTAINDQTLIVNQISNALDSKANKADLDELSGKFEQIPTGLATEQWVLDKSYITQLDLIGYAKEEDIPTKVSQLTNDVPYLSAIPSSYVQKTDLDEYATQQWVLDKNYITSSQVPSGAIYYAGEGLKLEDSTFSLTAHIPSAVSQLTNDLGYLTSVVIPDEYVTEDELAIALEPYAIKASDLSGLATKDELANYYTSTQVDEAISAAVSSVPSTVYTGEDGIKVEDGVISLTATLSSITNDAGFITVDALADYAKTSAIPTKISDLENDSQFATSANVATIVESYGYQTEAQVSAIASGYAGTDVDYNTVFAMLSSGDTDTLTITTVDDKIVFTAAGGGGGGDKTYHGDGGIEVNNVNDTISISANFLSANALDNYGDKTWVETNFLSTSYSTTIGANSQAIEDIQGITGTFALKADIPADIDDFATSAEVSSIVGSLSTTIRDGLASTSDIPTTVEELTDSSDYAKKTDLEGLVSTAQIADMATTGYVTGYCSAYITSSDLPAQLSGGTNIQIVDNEINFVNPGYITDAALADYAQLSDIPSDSKITGLAKDYVDTLDLATTYATKVELSSKADETEVEYISSFVSGLPDQISNKANSADVYTKQEANAAFLTATTVIPTKISDLTNDSQFATSANVSSIVESYGYITNSALDYEGVLPISVSNDHKISIDTSSLGKTYTAGYGLGLSGENNTEFYLTAQIPTSATISSIASAVTDSFVAASGVYTGTGLMIDDTDNTLNVVLSAANDSNMIVDVDQDGVIWLSSIAQGGGTTYTAGSGIIIDNGVIKTNLVAGSNVTFSVSDNAVTINATGGGGGTSDLTGVSQLDNDTGFITNEDLTVRQRVVTNTTTFAPYIEIYQNEYTPQTSAITLSAFDVDLTNLPTSASVATFEEWVYTATPITGITLDAGLTQLGDLPTSYTSGCYYVFVRRIVNVGNNTTQQFISFAYEFPKTV